MSSAVLATLGSAAGSGLLASDAAAQVAARRDDDDSPGPLLVAPANAANPILLASHRSHQSHHSSSGVGRSRPLAGDEAPDDTDSQPPPPPKPKPAQVVVVAYPGGKIFVNDKQVGQDQTATLTLEPGSHKVRVVNRFLGEVTTTIEVGEGQTGSIPIHW